MFWNAIASAWVWTLLVAVAVMLVWRVTEAIARAPMLDVAVSLLTWVPWVVASIRGGWGGFFGCIVGQFFALQTFAVLHQVARGYRGPTIRKTLDGIVGPVRNHLGLWLTIPALPVFLSIRLAEVTFYPMLVVVLKFPKYHHGEWVNISRQRFRGLVGHDLIWCLYCDWMTGVYSFGAEMLRNVESFWCPIKFSDVWKNENCQMDFPDLNKWVRSDGNMKDVRRILEEYYMQPPKTRSWFGHRDREENDNG
jgi:hypothetical protein